MLKRFSSYVFLFSLLTLAVQAQAMTYMGQGVRQNKTLSTFDSYKVVHYAQSTARVLDPSVARTIELTMLTDFGMLFTKSRMVEALEQALEANMQPGELPSFAQEINRFKKSLLLLPIGSGTVLKFENIPNAGLEITMNGPRVVFKSNDQNFSMKIFSIWLGKAHPSANNRDNLEQVIRALWEHAQ